MFQTQFWKFQGCVWGKTLEVKTYTATKIEEIWQKLQNHECRAFQTPKQDMFSNTTKKNTEQSNWYMHPALFLTGITLPETNITPTRKPSQKENCFPTIHFHVLCQFQGGYFKKVCSYFYWHGAFWNDWRGALWVKLKKDIAEPKNISRRSQLKHICTARYKYIYIDIYMNVLWLKRKTYCKWCLLIPRTCNNLYYHFIKENRFYYIVAYTKYILHVISYLHILSIVIVC